MQSMWKKVAHAIGRPELIEKPRFVSPSTWIENAVILDEIISNAMRVRTLEENLAYYAEAGVTVGPICDVGDLLDHDYIGGRGVLEDFQDLDRLPMHAIFPWAA